MKERLAPLVVLGKEAGARAKEGGFTDASAALAFWAFLSLFPALIAIIAMLGSLDRFLGTERAEEVRTTILEHVDQWLAGDAFETVRDVIVNLLNEPRGTLAVFGLLAAVWSVSKGFAGLCRALARFHGTESHRSGIISRLWGLVLGLVSIVTVLVVTLQLVLGPLFGIGEGTSNPFVELWTYGRVPFLIAVSLLWLSAMLKYGPALEGRLRRFLPGATVSFVALAAVLGGTWLLVSEGLVEANPVLGAIGGVLVVLVVLQLLARCILVGGIVNAMRFDRQSAAADAEPTDAAAPAEAAEVAEAAGPADGEPTSRAEPAATEAP